MKNKIQLLALTILLSGSIFAQTTWTVDNTPGAPADFTFLQAAINSSSPGDILLVQGSPTSYGTVTLNKSLTLKGPGYYLGHNPNTQVQLLSAKIDNLSIETGAEGSAVKGLNFQTLLKINTSNILISQNWIYKAEVGDNVSSVILNSNYLDTYSSNSSVLSIGDYCSGINMNNNYVYGFINFSSSSSMTIENNYFYYLHFSYIHNSLIQNNVFRNYYNGTIPSNNNTVRYNIFISSLPSVFDCCGNFYASSTTIFIDPSDPRYSIDGQYILRAGSLAIGAGHNGVDIGIFGGADPYILSGIPDIPNIYQLDVPITGYSIEGITVDIKAKANN